MPRHFKHLLNAVSVLLLAAFASMTSHAQTLEPTQEVVRYQDIEPSWALSPDRLDPTLQAALEARVYNNAQMKILARQGNLRVALLDVTVPEFPRLAMINGTKTVYAASLPKIAILLAVHQRIADGDIEMTPEAARDLQAMIRKSSNSAATRMIDHAGGLDAVNAVLERPEYGLYSRNGDGGLWVGKRYAKQGRRVTDPVSGNSHAANAFQVARFYQLLDRGELVSSAVSRDMKEALANPGIRHKFVAGLNDRVPLSRVLRKSGTWRSYHADSVFIDRADGRRYILVGLVESDQGEQVLRQLVPLARAALSETGS